MASVASPNGLIPKNSLGSGSYNGGILREFPVKANVGTAIYNGQLVQLSTAGLPAGVTTTPDGPDFASDHSSSEDTTDATAGIMGVMQGCRYISAEGQLLFKNFLPADIITGGATDVVILVNDDPNAVFQIQGNAALGTFNSGTNGSGFAGAVGMNAELTTLSAGSTSTGKSGMALLVGSNGGSLAATSTHAMRIIGVVPGTEGDTYPEFLVKYNVGVHSYTNSLGLA
tara:strand:- start:543 stop:1226 length:684 start_codon:yes stop_codon:yes gene_type:complete